MTLRLHGASMTSSIPATSGTELPDYLLGVGMEWGCKEGIKGTGMGWDQEPSINKSPQPETIIVEARPFFTC